MTDNLAIYMLNVLGPIFIITLIGYIMGKSNIGLHAGTLSKTVILVATPALIFSTLASTNVSGEAVGTMALSAILCVIVAGGLGLLVLKLAGMPFRSFLPALMMPNTGNIGLPLVFLTFGQDGLKLAASYFFVIALLQHSVGISISAGSYRLSQLLRQPLIYAVAGVLIVISTGIEVPVVILTTTKMLGGMMIPAMLILLGSSLASLSVSDLKPAVVVAIARLAIGLFAGLFVIMILSLEGAVAGSVFLLATMPTAIVTYVFAERYQTDSAQVAGSVLLSTLLTFACLPVLLWMAIEIAGEISR